MLNCQYVFAKQIIKEEGLNESVTIFKHAGQFPHHFVVIGNDCDTMVVADPWPDLPAPYLYQHIARRYQVDYDPTGAKQLKWFMKPSEEPETSGHISKIPQAEIRRDITTPGVT